MNHCAWSKSCFSAGPFLALIDGEWFECTEPEKCNRPLYCAAHAKEFQGLSIRNVITEDGESRRNAAASPYLLYPRRMIDKAIADGKETSKGEPTEDALLSREWVCYKPDWRDSEDWYGSFEWCCHWLGIDIETERQRAIDLIDAGLAKGYLAARREKFSKQQSDLVMKALGQPAPSLAAPSVPPPAIHEPAKAETPQLEIAW